MERLVRKKKPDGVRNRFHSLLLEQSGVARSNHG
jgi:hypothetical protein